MSTLHSWKPIVAVRLVTSKQFIHIHSETTREYIVGTYGVSHVFIMVYFTIVATLWNSDYFKQSKYFSLLIITINFYLVFYAFIEIDLIYLFIYKGFAAQVLKVCRTPDPTDVKLGKLQTGEKNPWCTRTASNCSHPIYDL